MAGGKKNRQDLLEKEASCLLCLSMMLVRWLCILDCFNEFLQTISIGCFPLFCCVLTEQVDSTGR